MSRRFLSCWNTPEQFEINRSMVSTFINFCRLFVQIGGIFATFIPFSYDSAATQEQAENQGMKKVKIFFEIISKGIFKFPSENQSLL